MNVKMRYVTARPNKANPKRWYWQRPGFPVTRLPDDAPSRWSMVERLNAHADKAAEQGADFGTVSWCVEKYRGGEKFRKLSTETKRIYERWCEEYATLWGWMPIQSITRRVVVDFSETLKDMPSTRMQAVAVLSRLFETARYHGIATENPCHKLELAKGPSRDQYLLPEDEARIMALAGDRMKRTLYLLLYTAQRPGDVLAMTWAQWDGDTIRVRQEKTRRLVEVPCHAALRAVLTATKRESTMIAGWRGAAKTRYAMFNTAFRELMTAANQLDLQARDFRRTAVVRLAAAGCTVPEIASITGHSVETTQRIIDTYYTRTLQVARNAIAKWEAMGESNATVRRV